ncbi:MULTISPECIES: ANTAR domain-containing response regulator [Aminobacter]|uniref:AmiR/NasT family two-component response regulator n=1 Tax=Aminobacter niigataensis TaxID=83265 RepID=A0ABR6L2N2_9HYPH|nr:MULTISPECIES: ANTAR domain-containing protein [Aminobacter]MBB4651008.1 AmiR/NasT family two-component response regulator [Aminobacter niigataensis]
MLQPKSSEGEELWQHLNRIGCQVQTNWPPPAEIPANTDVVFVFVRPIVEGDIVLNWNADDPPAVLIAIVDYENPIIVEKVLRLRAQAVIGLPLRTFGILANLLLSVNNHRREQRLRLRVERMDAKLKAHRDIDKAKAILMAANNVSEQVAYETLREQAMNKRTTIEAIAMAVITARDLL